MARKVFLILLALVLALSVGLVACAGPREVSIRDLKGPDWMEYVGTVVTVEGIFVRDPIPMLLTDLDIVKMNMPLPEDQYIILIGDLAENIDPEDYGGAKLKLTGEVVAMNDPDNYWGEYVAIHPIALELLEMIEEYQSRGMTTPIEPAPQLLPSNSYAVLFSGGYDPANNFLRYWNDLKFMYSTLINTYNYTPDHIWVLYANGSPPEDPATGLPDTSMPVNYSATQTNLELVFNSLKATTTIGDFIFVFTTNHGGGFWKELYSDPDHGGQVDTNGDEPVTDALSEAVYNLDLNEDGDRTDSVSWDEVLYGWEGWILDDAFSNIFADLDYERMVIVMEQCFSGGLISDMAGSNRIIISATSEYEPSRGMCNYDIFSYYFTCAINGADDHGNTVDADTNKDGKVSMVEAFNYAVSKDTQETPYYEDNGDGDPHSGPVPNGGDGTLGSNTFL